jgi:dTDP-3-amino-3,4,6-trideoxy-alpha-D-glucose transaminase
MQDQQLVRAETPVPFLDLGRVHRGLRDDIVQELNAVIEASKFVNGPQVAEFEDMFAAYCGTRFCVGVASGLDALRLGLLAAGLEPGDEVIVPAMTFVATFEAVRQAGGRPLVVDVSERDYNIDPEAVAPAGGPRTRFLLPVHLYGQMADMHSLRQVAAQRGIGVLEDACQAHGATRDGARAGNAGLAAAFSFYPTKNLGAMGDAGALVTDDADLAAAVCALREHGQRVKYRHEREGYTARLDTFQAVVLKHKLAFLDDWNDERRALAAYYFESLDGVGDLRLPPVPSGSDPVWHVYAVRTDARDELAAFLAEHGIATALHYPEPPHLSSAYSWLSYGPGDFPVAEALANELLSLPLFPGMSEAEVDSVITAVRDFFSRD